jgi:hypothetical protein
MSAIPTPVNTNPAFEREDSCEKDAASEYFDEARQAGQECLDAALDYLTRGWSALAVCPPDHVGVGKTHGQHCTSPGKAPWGEWKKYQSQRATEQELRKKWHDNPQLNVGVALGPVSGIIRVDSDGEEGEQFLQEMSGGDLPETLEMTSGGNGRGLLYAIPDGVTLRPTHQHGKKVHEGVSLLGEGSQTVMPPSRHVSGRRYAWVPGHGPDEIEAATAPPWLIGLMSEDGRRPSGKDKAATLAEGEIISDGRRDTTLTSLAGTMRRRGMTPDEIFAGLLVVNDRCDPPLDEAQVRKIANSVGRYSPSDSVSSRHKTNGDRKEHSASEQVKRSEEAFRIGPLALQPGQPRQSASGKISVPINTMKDGAIVFPFVVTTTPSSRKEPERVIRQMLGDDPARDKIGDVLTALLAHAAGRLANKQAPSGPTIYEILSGKAPEALQLACRTERGMWSERRGAEICRADFVTSATPELIVECEKASDAPRDEKGVLNRAGLIRLVQLEMGVLWAHLIGTLPPAEHVELGKNTEAGKKFREAMVALWTRTQTFEVVKDREAANGEIIARSSLVSRVHTRAKDYLADPPLVYPAPREKWRRIQHAFDAWWRPWADKEGQIHILLAMRASLAGQTCVDLPGVSDQVSLTRLGGQFGVTQSPPPGVGDVFNRGKMRLAVLALDLAEELLSQPMDDDEPREPGEEG